MDETSQRLRRLKSAPHLPRPFNRPDRSAPLRHKRTLGWLQEHDFQHRARGVTSLSGRSADADLSTRPGRCPKPRRPLASPGGVRPDGPKIPRPSAANLEKLGVNRAATQKPPRQRQRRRQSSLLA